MLFNLMLFLNFSDWIIFWFILYIFNIINSNHNPIFVVLIGFIYNLSFIIKLILEGSSVHIFTTINLIIKIFMGIYLIKNSVFKINDLIKGIFIFIIYNIWLYKIHDLTLIDLININLKSNRNYNKKLNINEVNEININKLNENYNKYFKNINLIIKKYKNSINKSNLNIDENKLNKIIFKYTKKLNKIKTCFNLNLSMLSNN